MKRFDLTQLRDDVLARRLDERSANEKTAIADLVAHIAEYDARRLYAPAGYPSMHAYCVRKLNISEGAAWRRIHVAKKARQLPEILEAMADGRVHLSGMCLLVPHLNVGNVVSLIEAASHRCKAQIERMLAERFPQVEVQRLDGGVSALTPPPPEPAWAVPIPSAPVGLRPGAVEPKPMAQEVAPDRVAPITAQRFSLQTTIDRPTHDNLRYAQELTSWDVPVVLSRALGLLVPDLEKQKFAQTDRPGSRRETTDPRTIPAHVKRAVWARDEGCCTFVGQGDHRCESREHLEFDHIVPVALGGKSDEGNIRLRCRTHNQLEAERVFGRDFMEKKRSEQGGRAVDPEDVPEPV